MYVLVDSNRGPTKEIVTNNNSAEGTSAADEDLTAFTSTGFNLGEPYNNSPNESGASIVAWCWRCNGGTTSTHSSGNITTTCQANQDAGFSICTYTGVGGDNKTASHGLGAKPEMIIVKKRNSTGNWVIWNHQLASGYAYEGTWAQGTVSGGSPSKYVISVDSTYVEFGDAGENNQDNDTYVMYCWRGGPGFSKFGEFEGNGNADGTYVQCGFKPAFVLINAQYGEHSTIHDTARSPDNTAEETLLPGASASQETHAYNHIDILSNGFKIRTSDYRHNKANDYLMYMAFAETPFKYATAR